MLVFCPSKGARLRTCGKPGLMPNNSLTGYQLRVIAILALINFVNYADRLVLPPLFPLLREQFHLESVQLGSLQVVLQIVFAAATFPLGLLADRMSRTRIIAAGVVFWSLATFLTGLAPTFGFLLLARGLVGIGEAAYAPAAQSMISEAFPLSSRARAQAVFAAGMLGGGTTGLALGGVIGSALGWRPAFFLVGVPGLLLGLNVLHLAEPPRSSTLKLVPIGRLLRIRAYAWFVVSGVLITAASLAFITWGTDFLVRWKDFSLREAGASLGTTLLLASIVGALVGGSVADWMQKRWIYGRVLVVAIAFLVAAPFVLWALYAEEKTFVLAAFFLAAFFMAWYHGPVTAVIHDLTPPRAHATAIGGYMFVTQLVGGALGPYAVGKIDDLSDLVVGLKVALGLMVAGALCFFLVIHFIRRDGLHHPLLDPYRAEASD